MLSHSNSLTHFHKHSDIQTVSLAGINCNASSYTHETSPGHLAFNALEENEDGTDFLYDGCLDPDQNLSSIEGRIKKNVCLTVKFSLIHCVITYQQ